jgi:DNA-binding FadR family transcriptional regulator
MNMLTQTNRLTLVEQVARQLQKLIETGEWKVGMRIPPEPELMEKLQVSRNTLREAVRALTYAGLLKTKQGDGTYVCASSVLGSVLAKVIQLSDVLQTLEVRHALEKEAAYLAAARRTPEEMTQLRQYLDNCRLAVDQKDPEAYAKWDGKFHNGVIAASHNELLEKLFHHITDGLEDRMAETSDDENAAYHESHELLYRAIEAKDSTQAVEAVQLYMDRARNKYLQTMSLHTKKSHD